MSIQDGSGTGVPDPARFFLRGLHFDVLFPALVALVYSTAAIVLHKRFFPIGDIDLETDFYGDLVVAARHLAEGHFAVHDFAWKGPLYAFVLVPLHGLLGDWYRAAVFLSAVSAGLFLFVAYRLVLRLFDRRTAILSMVVSAVVVEFVVQSHRAVTDLLFLALVYASIDRSLWAHGRWHQHALAGALAGLAFLTRYNGLFLLGGTAAMLAIANVDRAMRRERLQSFAVYAAAFLLVCAPWFLANWLQAGKILETRNLENIVNTYYGDQHWQDDPLIESGALPALVERDPGHFAAAFARNLAGHARKIVTNLLGWPLGLLPLFGIFGLLARPPNRRQAAFYAFAVAYWLFMGVVFYQPRFFLPMILPCVVAGFALGRREGEWRWGGGAIAAMQSWLQGPGRKQIPWAAVTTLLVVVVLFQTRRIILAERMLYERRPLFILDAARALAAKEPAAAIATREGVTRARPRILARKGHIAYYAGFEFTPVSGKIGSLEELVGHARTVGAQYFAYSKIEYSMLPRLLFFAVNDRLPFLEEVYRGPSIRVFRFAEENPRSLSDAERLALLQATLQAARTQGRPAAIYLAQEDLGRHAFETRDFEAAAHSYEAALEIAGANRSVEMDRYAASARHSLAGVYLHLARWDDALNLLQENLDFYARHGTQRLIAQTHERMALAYERSGRADEARRERERARAVDPTSGGSSGGLP